MEWLSILAAWVSTVGVILGFASYFLSGGALKNEDESQIRSVLFESTGSDWTRAANRLFLRAFDRLYGSYLTIARLSMTHQLSPGDEETNGLGTEADRIVWYGIKAAFAALIGISITLLLSDVYRGPTELVLWTALAIALLLTMMAVGMVGIMDWGRADLPVPNRGLPNIPLNLVLKLFSGIIGLIFGAMLFTIIGGVLGNDRTALIWIGLTGFFLLILSVPLTFVLPRYLPIHPWKAMISSLVVIVILGMIQRDAGANFVDELGTRGPIIFSFVAFNLFADVVSLWETRWILQKSSDKGILGLFVFLGIDLILSASIFLFLPALLGEIPVFWEAAQFRGERPWLGILFWSTFSTSAVFYVFVIAALLLRLLHSATQPLRGYARHQPVKALTATMILIVSVLFLVGFGGTAIVESVF